MGTTWSCGVRSLPASIVGDPPVSTAGVLWMCQGFVVGAQVFEGKHVSDLQLRQSFEAAATRPMDGAPQGRPDRIRTASPSLAGQLRNVLPKVHVEVQPTPDIDDAFDDLARSLSRPHLTPFDEFMELDEAVREPLVRAALEVFELYPWEVFPADAPVRVDVPKCGLRDGRLTVMGHAGESYGLMLFSTPADLDFFATAGESSVPAAELDLPKCYSLNYEPIDPAIVGDDPSNGPFPLPLLTVFEDGAQRQPSRSEAKLLLAVIIGLARFTKRNGRKIIQAGHRAAGIKGRYRADVLGERVEVRISADF